MGARLVAVVCARWSHLSDRAFRVLVRMAVTALDDATAGSQAGLYFGGQEPLAETLRSVGGAREARLRNVRHAVSELIAAGAIERTATGRAGQHSVFRLTLWGARSIDELVVDNPHQVEPPVPPVGGPQAEPLVPPEAEPAVPPQAEHSAPLGGTSRSPQGVEEPLEERYQEDITDLRTAVTPVENHKGAPTEVSAAPRLRLVPPAGNGFCMPCYAAGRTTVATDPVGGSACARCLREAS